MKVSYDAGNEILCYLSCRKVNHVTVATFFFGLLIDIEVFFIKPVVSEDMKYNHNLEACEYFFVFFI